MTGLQNKLGNKIVSQTDQCSTGTTADDKFVFIDTVGLKDSRDEHEARYKVIDFLLSFKDGMDVIFFVVQHGVFGNDDRDLFDEIYQKLLTQDAYQNSCLVITNYDKFDPKNDSLYKKNSEKQKMLIDELRKNKNYAYVLEKFENRVFYVDIPPKELTEDEKLDTSVEERNERKRKASQLKIESFLEDFHPPHFDCENLQQLSRIQKDNDRLKEENGELQKENNKLKINLKYETDRCDNATLNLSKAALEVSKAEGYGRVATGVAAGIGVGATLGSLGGPVGTVAIGAVGGLIGGILGAIRG